jgi:hypothetical protein
MMMAHRTGAAVVKEAAQDVAATVAKALDASGLHVEVLPVELHARSRYAVDMLRTLERMASFGRAFASCIASFVSKFADAFLDHAFPALVAIALRSLSIKLFSISEFKILLGEAFVRHYPDLFLRPNAKKALDLQRDLSVQLLTSPSVVHHVVDKAVISSIFSTLLNMLATLFIPPSVGSGPANGLSFNKFVNSDLFTVVARDLKYVLKIPDVPLKILSSPPLFGAALDVLIALDGLAPITCEKVEHVLYDSEDWLHALTLTLNFHPLVAALMGALAAKIDDPILCAAVVDAVVEKLPSYCAKYAEATSLCVENLEAGGWRLGEPVCASSRRVSFVHPFPRFFLQVAQFVLQKHPQLNGPPHLCSPILIFVARVKGAILLNAAALLDAPLRCVAVSAQIGADVWSRNGMPAANLEANYASAMFVDTMAALDVELIQVMSTRGGD